MHLTATPAISAKYGTVPALRWSVQSNSGFNHSLSWPRPAWSPQCAARWLGPDARTARFPAWKMNTAEVVRKHIRCGLRRLQMQSKRRTGGVKALSVRLAIRQVAAYALCKSAFALRSGAQRGRGGCGSYMLGAGGGGGHEHLTRVTCVADW